MQLMITEVHLKATPFPLDWLVTSKYPKIEFSIIFLSFNEKISDSSQTTYDAAGSLQPGD